MNNCQLDFPHAPIWCDYHFAEQQRTDALSLQREHNRLLRQQNDLLRQQEDTVERFKPSVPYNPSTVERTSIESQKPQIRGVSL